MRKEHHHPVPVSRTIFKSVTIRESEEQRKTEMMSLFRVCMAAVKPSQKNTRNVCNTIKKMTRSFNEPQGARATSVSQPTTANIDDCSNDPSDDIDDDDIDDDVPLIDLVIGNPAIKKKQWRKRLFRPRGLTDPNYKKAGKAFAKSNSRK
jgi:hypothetical protein